MINPYRTRAIRGVLCIAAVGALLPSHSVAQSRADSLKIDSINARKPASVLTPMHDGSIKTLEEVVEHYMRGGRLIASGPNAGDGSKNPFKNGFVTGFDATAQEKADLVEFLRSLTDSTFLTNPKHANPWPSGRNPAP